MSGLISLILIFGFVYFLDRFIKTFRYINGNKHISDMSYQKYARFYGQEAHIDNEFKKKLEIILNMIVQNLKIVIKKKGVLFYTITAV